MKPMWLFVLFYLKVSHSFIPRGCAEVRDFLGEVMLLPTLLTLFSELSQSRMLKCEHCSGYRIFLETLIALISKDVFGIPSMIRYLITKRSLTVLPSPFVQVHISSQRARLAPKLCRPHRFPEKQYPSRAK